MKSYLWIIVLAIWWGFSGLALGAAFNALYGGEWLITCAGTNVIAGMLMLLVVTRSERSRHLFYEGRDAEQPGNPIIGLLWAIPFTLLVIAVMWWLLAQVLK